MKQANNPEQDSLDSSRGQKRDAILAEAARQFNERGYFDTRLEDIAEKVGAAKTSISYHFKSKEALLEEIYEQSCVFSDAEITVASTAATGLERTLQLIRSYAYAHANALSGKRAPLALISDLCVLANPEHDHIKSRYNAHVQAFRDFLAQGLEDNSVSVRSVDAATFFLLSLLHWLPRWLSTISIEGHDDAIDSLCDVLRNGIAQDRSRQPAKAVSRHNEDEYPDIFDRETRNKLKREAFLRTGTRYLNRKGFRSLSLNEIASDLGVTRGAFYYYIEDKDALLHSCFERSCDLIEKAQTLGKRGAEDSLGAIERTLRYLFEGHITEFDPLVRLSLINVLQPAQKAVIGARLKRLSASFAELHANAMIDGSARPTNLEATEQIVMGLVMAASRRRLAVTPLSETWKPAEEPLTASAAYFEPLFKGLAS